MMFVWYRSCLYLWIAGVLFFGSGCTQSHASINGPVSPIRSVPAAGITVLEVFGAEPISVRLTQPAQIAGILLPAGSIIRQKGTARCSLFPAEDIEIGGVRVPAASEIELTISVTGPGTPAYQWNGKLIVGASMSLAGYDMAPGDGIFFTGQLLQRAVLSQIRIGSQREMHGQWYPDGAVIYINQQGIITGETTGLSAEALATQRAFYWKNKAERTAQCNELCINHPQGSDALSQCIEQCVNS